MRTSVGGLVERRGHCSCKSMYSRHIGAAEHSTIHKTQMSSTFLHPSIHPSQVSCLGCGFPLWYVGAVRCATEDRPQWGTWVQTSPMACQQLLHTIYNGPLAAVGHTSHASSMAILRCSHTIGHAHIEHKLQSYDVRSSSVSQVFQHRT